jgi:hypothetical protein
MTAPKKTKDHPIQNGPLTNFSIQKNLAFFPVEPGAEQWPEVPEASS